jgi:hypothetical protein
VHGGALPARRARTLRPTRSSCSKSARSLTLFSRRLSCHRAYVNCRCDQEFVKCQSEPEAPAMDAVKSDLEGQCDTELRLVQAVLGILLASAIQP